MHGSSPASKYEASGIGLRNSPIWSWQTTNSFWMTPSPSERGKLPNLPNCEAAAQLVASSLWWPPIGSSMLRLSRPKAEGTSRTLRFLR